MERRSSEFRSAIAGFIEERRAAKVKDGVPGNDANATRYEYHTWLTDAARRVGQIQAVTHVLKAIHPDAKGTSLHVDPNRLDARPELGSQVLGNGAAEDIVGNAAALDVYKLLKVEVEGRRLLDWFEDGDSDLLKALSPDGDVAAELANAFRGLRRSAECYSSHAQAKQLYWCVDGDATDDSHFHLLQPLFPSSLVHAVHEQIQHGRFGDEVVEARKARRDKKPHPASIPDYPGLAYRKLGGTKPQNISQLNSERRGINYLLASLPPRWRREHPRKLHHVTTAIPGILFFDDTREILDRFVELLKSYDQRRLPEQQQRERMEQRLGATLAAFGAATTASFEPGWTRVPECELAPCEKAWLDPGRREMEVRAESDDADGHADDRAFNEVFDRQDWPDEVAARFAEWLNGWLRKHDLPVGDVELRHFARQAIVDAVDWANPIRRDLPSQRSWAKGGNP
ncbi:MAG: type I-F CRISPR-associated protein Csy1 [Pseudoxanthomonas suwonensis]|nr:type I-F CRISPR-associated protein Csy1 [Pseudoxanthomonas suwonensis]